MEVNTAVSQEKPLIEVSLAELGAPRGLRLHDLSRDEIGAGNDNVRMASSSHPLSYISHPRTLAPVYGLTLGFQKRRTTRVFREDVQGIHDLLHVNMGRGFFAWDRFSRAPQVWTDASKSSKYAGGGYVSARGAYRWWVYGGSARRKPIDFLEGDAVVLAAEDLGPGWYHCVVPIHLDNSSFQRSAGHDRRTVCRHVLESMHRHFDSFGCVNAHMFVSS